MVIFGIITALLAAVVKLLKVAESGTTAEQEEAMMEVQEELKASWDKVKFAKEKV